MSPTTAFLVYTFGVAMLFLGIGIVIGVGWRVVLHRRRRTVPPAESRTMPLCR